MSSPSKTKTPPLVHTLYIGPGALPRVHGKYPLEEQIADILHVCKRRWGDGSEVQPRYVDGQYLGLQLRLPEAPDLDGETPVKIAYNVPFRKKLYESNADWTSEIGNLSSRQEQDIYKIRSLELGYLLELKNRFVTKWPVPPVSNYIAPEDTYINFSFLDPDRCVYIDYRLGSSYRFRMKSHLSNVVWMLMEGPITPTRINSDKQIQEYHLVMQLAVAPTITYIPERSGRYSRHEKPKRYAVPHPAIQDVFKDRFWNGMPDALKQAIKAGPPSGQYLTYRIHLVIEEDDHIAFIRDMSSLFEAGLLPKASLAVSRELSPSTYMPLSTFEHLPYKIYFQLEALAAQNQAILHMLGPDVIHSITPRPMPPDVGPNATPQQQEEYATHRNGHQGDVDLISGALKRMASGYKSKAKEHLYNFADVFKAEKKNEHRKMYEEQRRKQAAHDVNYRWIHKASSFIVTFKFIIVTPTAVHYIGPQYELINRVIRDNEQLLNNFLRVQFCEEDHERMASTDHDLLLKRISTFLDHGIVIGGRRYEFLHYSSSQQRNAGCWFYSAPDNEKTVQWVRGWMENEYHTDPFTGRTYLFFDGIGRIGRKLGIRLWSGLGKFMPHMATFGIPTAFQLRVAGAKGMLTVDESIPENELHLRKNMIKFEKDYYVMEVIRTAFYSPCYLNRQLILLLTTLGVPGENIMTLMDEQVRRLDSIFESKEAASAVLKSMTDGWGISTELIALIEAGFWDRKEPFLMNMLRLYRATQMREIQKRTRIHVPKAVHLLGVMDETGLLPEGQIIVRIAEPPSKSLRTIVARGLITRSPAVHPGDVQIVQATAQFDNIYNLKHHRDVIVFSRRGVRPLPNQLSGGDLDGDSFVFIWDERLIPSRTVPAMDYEPVTKERTVAAVSVRDVKAHFVDYIAKNTLGKIDHAHMAWADREEKGAECDQCLQLAELHSTAVDYAKSGISADFPEHLQPRTYPHWLEKSPTQTFISRSVIGKIYDKVTIDVELVTKIKPDPILLLPGRDKYLKETITRKAAYDREITALMNQYSITSELELISSYILMVGDGKKKPFELNEDIMPAITAINKRYREAFHAEKTSKGEFVFSGSTYLKPDDETVSQDVLLRASCWYDVSYSTEINSKPSKFEKPAFAPKGADVPVEVVCLEGRMISFCWVVYDLLAIILRRQSKAAAEGGGSEKVGGMVAGR
ncbi:hypothetical protein SmJEL517_g05295 [Synchytrium microbalum]|uniref:RNA-dependent RNA polymerase n=1 Tax=Synchytrium microbalum TaxID=1806994 RepID=A0A507BPZ5_9FUNG|nr:uncharacterized protein SmJEL517_g05295 [Synchytrium microbalum]TPX31367.1 hypothetical protein SmJEL517_g05295 [Synchytrium microbalum]